MNLKQNFCIVTSKADYLKQYNDWFPKIYLSTLNDKIIPKFLNICIDETKRDNWQNYFDVINPKNSLGYMSEELYLKDNGLSEQQVVLNSIEHVFNNLEFEDIVLLQGYFLELISNEKIKVLKENNLSIYTEIIDICNYILNIQKLLNMYPINKSEYKGTANTTNFKKLIGTQIYHLDDRLNHTYFPLSDITEIQDTELLLKLLNMCLDKDKKQFAEWLNFINIRFGLESKILNIGEKNLKIIRKFLNFYNGIKTQKIELIQSVAIYINMVFKNLKVEDKQKANIILNILKLFFLDEICEYDKSNKKRTFSFNANSLSRETRVKTIYYDTQIYAYKNKNDIDILSELLTTGLHCLFNVKNIFEPELTSKNDTLDFNHMNSIFKEELKLSEDEIKVMNFIFKTQLELS